MDGPLGRGADRERARGSRKKLALALDQLEGEALAGFRVAYASGKPKPWSDWAFSVVFAQWQAWENGIPPTAGGYAQQNPRLLDAFARLSHAKTQAEREYQQRMKREAEARSRKQRGRNGR
jgi:hypothetical protein